MKLDYHIHTKLCKHASGEMEEYVEQAIKKGLAEIAFTDHIPLPQNFDLKHRMAMTEIEFYLNQIEKLKSRYREITILTGIEADFYHGFENFLASFLERFPFQIVILSVHFIQHWPAGNWVFKYDFPDRSLREVYADYLNALKDGIKTSLFNVIGHLDLIKKDGQPLLKHNRTQVIELLRLAQKHRMVVEINTSGLRKEINEPYPHQSLWPLLAEFELPVTLGSDAHAPNQVAFAFDTIEKQLSRIDRLKKVRFDRGKFRPVAWTNQNQLLSEKST